MKLMIASDIHGSAYYAEKMREAYLKEKADRLILLGDLLYHGPRNDLPKNYEPKTVIEILNSLKEDILCVRGNCDSEVDQMVLDFPMLADYAVVLADEKTLYLTHGHVFNLQNQPKLKRGDYLVNGHTHVPAYEKKDDFIYLNPGSVSIPKEGSGHSYIIYEHGDFKFKEL